MTKQWWPRSAPGFEGQTPSISFSCVDRTYNKRIFPLNNYADAGFCIKTDVKIGLLGNILSNDQNSKSCFSELAITNEEPNRNVYVCTCSVHMYSYNIRSELHG